MLVALLTFAGDIDATRKLLLWMEELGGSSNHDLVIVADAGTPFDEASAALEIGRRVFKSALLVTNERSVIGWVEGPKSLVIRALDFAAAHSRAILIMDSDAIPLSPGWLDRIEGEYTAFGRPYMGHLFDCNQPGLPSKLMSPIAVYPPTASKELFDPILNGHHWDVSITPVVVPQCHDTNLIHHLFGEIGNPPSFSTAAVPGTNIFSLGQIRPSAVIFHRNKDGTLIDLLRQEKGLAPQAEKWDGEAFFQMGRYGDLILLLPAFQEWYRRTGFPTAVVTSQEFGSVFDGVSYVKAIKLPHNWHLEAGLALQYGQKLFPNIQRIQLHGVGLPPATPDSLASYSLSMWERAGLLDQYHWLPLVFDRRSPEREAALVKKWRKTDKPLLLVNFDGATSPYRDHLKFVAELCQRFADRFEFLNTNEARGYRIYDLLGLMDVAAGLITIDTATLHLAAAAKCPYIALVRDDGQAGSIPKGNVALKVGYSEAMRRFPEIVATMDSWNPYK